MSEVRERESGKTEFCYWLAFIQTHSAHDKQLGTILADAPISCAGYEIEVQCVG